MSTMSEVLPVHTRILPGLGCFWEWGTLPRGTLLTWDAAQHTKWTVSLGIGTPSPR